MPRIQATDGSLAIVGNQSGGITGEARAGCTVEAINLSTAPSGRLHLVDTIQIAEVGEDGKFAGNLTDMREGDVIRLRLREPTGETSGWVTFKAGGMADKDTRNAQISLRRMDLTATDNGNVQVTHNTKRPLSEPGATLRFTNERTGESKDVQVTDEGSLPEGLTLAGKAGDDFKVAVSDSVNNADFALVAGTMRVHDSGYVHRVDLEDPDIMAEDKDSEGEPQYKPVRYTGPLFVDGIKADDVRQGAIGDCYLPSAMGAVAYQKPQAIRDAIKDNGDGTYTVRFFAHTWGVSDPQVVRIDVDGDLYSRSYGGPIYGSSLGTPSDPDKMELWFPLIEKAYAEWKGGYESIGNGGSAASVMSAILGVPVVSTWLASSNADTIYNLIAAAEKKGRPMTAGTHGEWADDKYVNTRIYTDHSYSILGVEEEDGVKYVRIRNPWGESEPHDNGPDDGFFRLEIGRFMELYRDVSIAQTPVDPTA